MKAIEVSHLFYSYSSKKELTLSDISFSIEKGQYVSIVGPNGSGKSTLARLLIGLLNKNEGEIYILGEKLDKTSMNNIRKHVGIIFQNPDNQFIGATVEDDIAFGLENRNIERSKMQDIVHDFASKVGMSSYLNKEPSSLSGGQKQRVAIAGVLALGVYILIMDESTSMLDPKGKKEILELIKKIKEENKDLTILSITHDIEEAYQSDYVVVLYDGKVALEGTPKEVFNEKNDLKKFHLSMPFLMELKDKLGDRGIDISKAKNIEEASDIICQLK